MTKIINLRRSRKQREREGKRKEASARAEAFGQSKAERAQLKAEKTRAARDLDGHSRKS